jgi:Zn-dependent M16 (insulinase) family peptidase
MAMKLLREFLTKPDFADSDRIENLVRMGSASAAKQLVNNANQFAVEYGMASGSPSHRFYNSLVNVNK